MLGAETFVSSILRLITTVVVLGAVYFFIVRPILDTTENAVHDASRQANQAQRAGELASQKAQLDGARQRARSYAQSALAGSQPWVAANREIRRCVEAAGTSLPKMKHCGNLGEAIVSRALSPRNIAVSYATSLDAQGSSSQADEVRHCVAAAGFRVLPMIHCRTLATRYLFG